MGEIAQELLDRFSDPSHPFNDRLHEIARCIESLRADHQLQAQRIKRLKKENATLRATAELVERQTRTPPCPTPSDKSTFSDGWIHAMAWVLKASRGQS